MDEIIQKYALSKSNFRGEFIVIMKRISGDLFVLSLVSPSTFDAPERIIACVGEMFKLGGVSLRTFVHCGPVIAGLYGTNFPR